MSARNGLGSLGLTLLLVASSSAVAQSQTSPVCAIYQLDLSVSPAIWSVLSANPRHNFKARLVLLR